MQIRYNFYSTHRVHERLGDHGASHCKVPRSSPTAWPSSLDMTAGRSAPDAELPVWRRRLRRHAHGHRVIRRRQHRRVGRAAASVARGFAGLLSRIWRAWPPPWAATSAAWTSGPCRLHLASAELTQIDQPDHRRHGPPRASRRKSSPSRTSRSPTRRP